MIGFRLKLQQTVLLYQFYRQFFSILLSPLRGFYMKKIWRTIPLIALSLSLQTAFAEDIDVLANGETNLAPQESLSSATPSVEPQLTPTPTAEAFAASEEVEVEESKKERVLISSLVNKKNIYTSENYGERKYPVEGLSTSPAILIVGWTAGTPEGDHEVFMKKDSVSVHYLIAPDGTITCYVPEDKRAWSSGHGCFISQNHMIRDINSYSISIFLSHKGHKFVDETSASEQDYPWISFPEAQINAFVMLANDVLERNPTIKTVVSHGDAACAPNIKGVTCAARRKISMGPLFPWAELRAHHGISSWPIASEDDDCEATVDHKNATSVQTALRKVGYCGFDMNGQFDYATNKTLMFFQMHENVQTDRETGTVSYDIRGHSNEQTSRLLNRVVCALQKSQH